MQSNFLKPVFTILLSAILFCSCKKDVDEVEVNPGTNTPADMPLKDATDIPIGVAVSFGPMLNDAAYAAVVKRDFDAVTFDYLMKHGAIVQSNGTMNFTNTDALVNAVVPLDIFGHVLGWHQNQNATYLKNYAGSSQPGGNELLTNPGFENGLTGWSVFNNGNPAGSATITTASGSGEVRSGTGSMKVINPTAYPGNQWRVQVSSSTVATTPGKQYIVSYWAKATQNGGSIRLSTGPSGAQYQGDQSIDNSWQQVSWTITASLNATTILFDMGQAANTYYIDDVSVKEITGATLSTLDAAKVDQALENFITAIVNRYKNKIKAWDVVNELFTEDGSIRDNANTPNTAADVFVWSAYLGRDYAAKAFNYAKAADPIADLYINDYNLEINNRKLDSLLSFVAEIKAKGAKVDGIGTQMHIFWNTPKTGIENMLKKLAATGLKIRISELDVRTSGSGTTGPLTSQQLTYQAAMVEYVVTNYRKLIPKAQQAGITVWGVNDKNSWLYNNGTEFPLLYDDNYNKKPAYAGFLQGLRN